MKIRPWKLLELTGYYFAGTSEDVDVYFEWEHKMNVFFSLCDCPEFEKVFIAAAQLIEDAQTWWSKEMIEGKHSGFVRNPTWGVMQNLMRKQYIPRDQYQDIRKQFRTLRQGDKTIMEYQKQFNHIHIRLNPGVSNENIINHFVDGLSEDIRFQLQKYKWNDLEELFQQTIKIEAKIQMKSIVMEKTHRTDIYNQIDQDLRTNPFEEGEYDEVMESKILKEEADYEYFAQHELKSMKPIECQQEQVPPTSGSTHGVQETSETKENEKVQQRMKHAFIKSFNKRNKDFSLFDFSPTTTITDEALHLFKDSIPFRRFQTSKMPSMQVIFE